MKVNDRLLKLVRLMKSEEDYKPLNYYAHALSVSDRTIQNDLDQIETLDDEVLLNIKRKQNVGIKLKSSDEDVSKFLSIYENNSVGSDDLDRRAEIVKILAIENQTVTYQKLSDTLFSSSSVIVKDIQAIKSLNIKGVDIISDRSGTRLEGSEYYIQKLLKTYFLNHIKLKDLEEDRESRKKDLNLYFDKKAVASVYEVIEEIEDVIKHQITNYYLISLEILLVVLTDRVLRDKHFDRDVNDLSEDYYETLTNFPFALDIVNKIQDKTGISFNEEEIRYISYQLFLHKIEININNKYLETVFEDDVKSIIKFVSDEVGIDMSKDERLYNSLIFHIIPLNYRVRSNVKIENPLYSDVVNADTKLFYIIWMAMKPFEEKYGVTLNNDEVSFLSIHFQVSLARMKVQQSAYVVCEMGLLTSELLTNKIKQNLPAGLTITPISKKDLYEKEKIDANFIISTVDLEERFEPYIKVSLLMNDADMRNIYDYYLKYRDHVYMTRERTKTLDSHNTFIDKKFIFINSEFETKGALFKHAERALKKEDIIKDGFLESVLQRENVGSTMIAENVALPHSNPQLSSKTQLLVYTLKKPILWDQTNEAQVVFLLVLSEVDGQEYLDTFLSLHEYVSDYRNIVELLKKDKKEIMKVLEML